MKLKDELNLFWYAWNGMFLHSLSNTPNMFGLYTQELYFPILWAMSMQGSNFKSLLTSDNSREVMSSEAATLQT